MTTTDEIATNAETMKTVLGLRGSPVGVRIIRKGDESEGDAGEPCSTRHMRFCQALMRARHGMRTVLCGENLACPAAARAFGFRPLPEPLRTGKGLIGFGITSEESVGKTMFEDMTTFEQGEVLRLDVFPLEASPMIPDVVIVEDEVEKLMWIVLASMHAHGGKRVTASTAVLQATCVDSTIIPFREQKLNFSFGCYGCRDATDIAPGESIIGFPSADLPAIVLHLDYLVKKALPHSREKHALKAFMHESESKDKGQSCSSL
jgi:uncharacterized protein (DUF169 family)